MQMMLPLFPANTAMITTTLGVFRRDSIVTYLHCGVPIFSHAEDDYKSFRYITSKFIAQGLCKLIDISDCFHVSYDSVKRYVKKLEDTGERGFFGRDNRTGGNPYKLMPTVVERIQKKLDAGKNNSEIARSEGVTEGAIRYALKKGTLKKTSHPGSSEVTERNEVSPIRMPPWELQRHAQPTVQQPQ
jgi:transposase